MKKNIQILFILGLIHTLISCSKENDTGIEGKWTSTSIILKNAFDFNGDGTSENEVKKELPCLNHELVLRNDRTGLYTSNLATPAPQPSTMPYTCFGENSSEIIWAESNKTILINGVDSSFEFQINILENNSLERTLLGINDEEEGRIIFNKQ